MSVGGSAKGSGAVTMRMKRMGIGLALLSAAAVVMSTALGPSGVLAQTVPLTPQTLPKTASPTPTPVPIGASLGPNLAALQIAGPTPTPAALPNIAPSQVQRTAGGNHAGTGVSQTFGDGAPMPVKVALPLPDLSKVTGSGSSLDIVKHTGMAADIQRTNDLSVRDTAGCYTGGLAPYPADTGTVLVGFSNDWNGGSCWDHEGDVFRGAARFDLSDFGSYITPARVLSAKLFFTARQVLNTDPDGTPLSPDFVGRPCGAGDQLLIAANNTWWTASTSGNGDWPSVVHSEITYPWEEYVWPSNHFDVGSGLVLLPQGSPAGADLLTPDNGWTGVDVTGLVRAWVATPDSNNGFVLRNTVDEIMDPDHEACLSAYSNFRLEVTYLWRGIFPTDPGP